MKPRILIAVTTHATELVRREAVRSTWFSWVTKLNPNVDVKFFSGPKKCADDPGDTVYLNCPDDYDHLPKKTYALVEWANCNKYIHVIKVDTDTYFLPLPEVIAELTKQDCVGSLRVAPAWNGGIAYPQGGCYSLSAKAQEAVLRQRPLFQNPGIEDGAVGKAIYSAGLKVTGDVRIKTDYRHGVPALGNDIISAHGCAPEVMRGIHEANLVRLLSAYSAVLATPAAQPRVTDWYVAAKPSAAPRRNIVLSRFSTVDGVEAQEAARKGTAVNQRYFPDKITLAVTSCSRHDLLKRTLESFAKHADLPIHETIIIEDSNAKQPAWLDSITGIGKITWLQNSRRSGQIISADRLVDFVRSEWVFWCEDDWQFEKRGFLQKSLEILKQHPEIWTVNLRGKTCNTHRAVDDPKYPFQILEPYYRGVWGGCHFNPGLRRLADWRRIGSYGKIMGYGIGGIIPEQNLSKHHLDLGYRIASLPDVYVTHTGEERSKAVETTTCTPPFKVLIAIPGCYQYEYGARGAGVKRNTVGRIKAIRETWIKDIAPFASYVDYKIFFGNATRNETKQGSWKSPARAKAKVKDDEVFLDVPDDYEHLPHKMQAIYKWALANGYDYVYKCDDDTWVYVDRLMRSGFEEYDQLGYSNCSDPNNTCNCYVTGGPGYWLSKRALTKVVNTPVNHWAEDCWVGSALKNTGLLRAGSGNYLPGFDAHVVSLPLPAGTVTAHAVVAEDMRRLYESL